MSDYRALAVLAVALGCSVDPQSGFTGVSAGSVGSAATTNASAGTSDGGETGSSGGSSAHDSGSEGEGTTAIASTGSSGAADESSGANASSEASSGGDGTPLDPQLDVPDMGEHCTTPGDLSECPGIAVCRFATVEYGICESCDACGNLNAPCVQGTDCDILFACYAGSCTNFCTLGTSECGPVDACLDVGHPTKGVCDPFA